jgi:thiopurine S-methyltransferase
MDASFWQGRWKEGRLGWHEGRPNSLLEAHLGQLGKEKRVFVPLCGKSEDLAFLAERGHSVVGVELVPEGLRAFFAEHRMEPRVSRQGRFEKLEAGPITLLAGDVFDLTPHDLAGCDALYDRAAVIALPQATRVRYAAHLRTLMPKGSRGLVVTLEYPQDKMEGPPFSVSEAELRQLYRGLEVTPLEERPWESPKQREVGVAGLERCYLIRF